MKRAALYARVSTLEQGGGLAVQLEALRRYADARGWTAVESVDEGVSGGQAQRAALDALLLAVHARRVDVVVCTKLDRLARSVRHLVAMVAEFQAVGVDLVVLDQAIDTTTPTGRLLFHVLASIAEFERDLIRERVLAGVRRAQAHGTRSGRPIGRPRTNHIDHRRLQALLVTPGWTLSAIARALGVHVEAVRRELKGGRAGLTNPGAEAAGAGPGNRGLAPGPQDPRL